MPRPFTDTELLLWNLEQNPNLASTMGSVAILDGTPDPDRLRATVAKALGHVAVLTERVEPAAGPLGVPHWRTDEQFDLDSHLRFIKVSGRGSRQSVLELATTLINDPFDRTRPLWSWTVISGLPRGRAAVVSKLHHSVADGQGALELAAHLLEFSEDAEPPPPIDVGLNGLGLGRAESSGEGSGTSTAKGTAGLGGKAAGAGSTSKQSSLTAGAERLISALGQAATTVQSPAAAVAAGQDLASVLKSLRGSEAVSGSTLWTERSRNRRAQFLSAPLEQLVRAGQRHERSVNDVFVAAATRAVVNYHLAHDVELDHVNATVVVSTREADDPGAHNAVTPVPVVAPGAGASMTDVLAAIGDGVSAQRERLHQARNAGGFRKGAKSSSRSRASQGILGPLTGLAGLLPSDLAAAAALDQSSGVDISTSNLPGPPMPVWIAGQRVIELLPLGPVAGTACNTTMLTYDATAYLGLHIDPAAINDPVLFSQSMADGFRELGVRRVKTG